MCTAKLHELKFVPNAMEIVFENKYFYIISEAVFVSLSLVRSMNRLLKITRCGRPLRINRALKGCGI